jgi:hypothetical protein
MYLGIGVGLFDEMRSAGKVASPRSSAIESCGTSGIWIWLSTPCPVKMRPRSARLGIPPDAHQGAHHGEPRAALRQAVP